MKSIEIISTHFGSVAWTRKLIERCVTHTLSDTCGATLSAITIVDNERRESNAVSLQRHSLVTIKTFEPDERQFAIYGHDHASAIERAIAESRGEIVVLLDCDAHPIRADYLKAIVRILAEHDAITAPDRRDPLLSHPCFMAFRRQVLRTGLHFDTWQNDRLDVGRSIRSQLQNHGFRVYVPKVERAFGGKWGNVFDGIIYHHGSGTFPYSSRHMDQVHPHCDFFARPVLKENRYSLTRTEELLFSLRAVRARLSSLGRSILRRQTLPVDQRSVRAAT